MSNSDSTKKFLNYKMLLCTIYRQPIDIISRFGNFFQHSVENAISFSFYIAIVGGLNVDFLSDQNKNIHMMRLNDLKNAIKEPTRVCDLR